MSNLLWMSHNKADARQSLKDHGEFESSNLCVGGQHCVTETPLGMSFKWLLSYTLKLHLFSDFKLVKGDPILHP